MILMANSIPKGFMFARLKEAIEEGEKNGSEQNSKKVEAICMMIMTKAAAEGHEKGVTGLMDSVDKTRKAEKFFDTNPG